MPPTKYTYLPSTSVGDKLMYACHNGMNYPCPGSGYKVDGGFVVTHRHCHRGNPIMTSSGRFEVFLNGSLMSTNLHVDQTIFHECLDETSNFRAVQPYIEINGPAPFPNRNFPIRVLPLYFVPLHEGHHGKDEQPPQVTQVPWPMPMKVTSTSIKLRRRPGAHGNGDEIVQIMNFIVPPNQEPRQLPTSILEVFNDPGPSTSGTQPSVQSPPPQGHCMVCLTDDHSEKHAIVPCGHSWLCSDCNSKRKFDICPICRHEIVTTLRVLDTTF